MQPPDQPSYPYQPSQPPDNQPPQYPYDPSQTPPPPPYQYPQPGNFGPPPQQPGRIKRFTSWYMRQNILVKLIVAALIAFVVIFVGSAAIAGIAESNQADNSPTPTAAVASQPTSAPTQAVAPTPTPSGAFTDALIGADISYFKTKYGDPVSVMNDTDYTFTGHLIVSTPFDENQAPYKTRVVSILLDEPAGQFWTSDQAEQKCSAFMPEDAKYTEQHTLSTKTGMLVESKKIYTSTTLAKQLPGKQFHNLTKSTKPGTFAVSFSYDSGSKDRVYSCYVSLNLDFDSKWT